MQYPLFFILILSMALPKTLFDFSTSSSIANWRIQDDVVMGGRSNGSFYVSEDGHGVFEGEVSLENNGGFSSVRYFPETISLTGEKKIRLRVKGDGSKYQLRVKQDRQAYYSYIAYFQTDADKWQTIEIELSEMYPSWRGRKLSGGNFSHSTIEELAFLIGNKKEQEFKLVIDKIEMID